MSVKQKFSARLNRKVWGYDAEIAGRRKRKFGFSTKQTAEIALANARVRENEKRAGVIIERADAPPVTVKELVERRSKQLQRNVARLMLARWLNTLPAGLRVVELTTAHLSTYADARLA